MVDDPQARRLAQNEVLFREVNENIVGMERRAHLDAGFVCECSHLDCAEVIPISVEEYELIHRERARFVMVRAHVVPEIERVISDLQSYVVVQKVGPGRPVAEEG